VVTTPEPGSSPRLSWQIWAAHGRSDGSQGPKMYTVNQIPSTPVPAAGLHLISACLCSARRLEGPPRSHPDPGFNRSKHAPEQGPQIPPPRRLGPRRSAMQTGGAGRVATETPPHASTARDRYPMASQVLVPVKRRPFRRGCRRGLAGRREAADAAAAGCHPDSWVTRSQT
jgi:hypothetical protein